MGCSASSPGDDTGEAAGAASDTLTLSGTYDDGTVVIVDAAGYLTATRRDSSMLACEYTFEGQVSDAATTPIVAHRGGKDIRGSLTRTGKMMRIELDGALECASGRIQRLVLSRESGTVDAGALGFWGVKSPQAAIFEGATRPASGFQPRIDGCRRGSACAAPHADQDQGVAILELGPAPWVRISVGGISGWMSSKDLYPRPAGTLGGACAANAEGLGCGHGQTCSSPASTAGICTVSGSQGVTAAPGTEGGPCEKIAEELTCSSGLDCVRANGDAPGVCTRKNLPRGSSCNTNADYDECAAGLECWGESDLEPGVCG